MDRLSRAEQLEQKSIYWKQHIDSNILYIQTN